jgi:hypothetical protein
VDEITLNSHEEQVSSLHSATSSRSVNNIKNLAYPDIYNHDHIHMADLTISIETIECDNIDYSECAVSFTSLLASLPRNELYACP